MVYAILEDWNRYSADIVGEVLPINMIDEDEEGVFVVGYDCGMEGPALTCQDGRIVRRVLLGFKFGESAVWH